ncbi:MAG: (2Fe-2S)-binding protein [Candidatus Marinimicrobia bacterium]|nr:(2Fe-2S)-binding protein [Candidatus Neomarinimicrobiota bacterium]
MEKQLNINGKTVNVTFTPEELLLNTLRQNGFTEVKSGCKEGECGACLVLLNGKPVNSCLVFTASVLEKDKILTVKGIGDLHEPHVIQEAFVDSGAVQCGFCTPGIVLASYALLQENPTPTDGEVKKAMDGNLCRCTGYVKIVEAVKLAAERLQTK